MRISLHNVMAKGDRGLQKIKDDVNKLSVAKRAKKDAYDLYTWNKRVTQILNRLNV